MLLAKIISLPISVILFVWMRRIKKADPFPKGSLAQMLIAGALCPFAATILTVLLGLLSVLIRIGPADLSMLLTEPTSEVSQGIAARIEAISENPTLFSVFFSTFVLTAVIEEGLKYLAMRLCLRRAGVMKTPMDALVCAAIVGLSFQVVEDLVYASEGVGTAILRAFTPMHFAFGAIMGFYYGSSAATGRKGDRIRALLIPILIHGLYDFGIKSLSIDDRYILLTGIDLILMLALTVYIILKIHRWSRDGTLSSPISGPQEDPPSASDPGSLR